MKRNATLEKNTRGRLLDAATREFARHGLAGARIDRIARRAGINKAMIYYHFSSKEHLYQSIIGEHVERIGEVLGGHVTPEADFEEVLLELSKMYHEIPARNRDLLSMLLHELADGGEHFRRAVQSVVVRRDLRARLKQMIGEGIRAGRLRRIETAHAVLSFVGMNLFYLIAAPIAKTVWEIKDEKKFQAARPHQVVDLFLYGIAKR